LGKTLFFIKPDAVQRGLVGEIISRVEKEGFKISHLKMVRLTKKEAKKFYEVHKDKHFYEALIDYVSCGAVVAMVLEKESAIEELRDFIGATDPKKAKRGTIRALFGIDVTRNSVHASDSFENAKKEIDFFFPRK
jgi:nucleoside-diphosphate kinase